MNASFRAFVSGVVMCALAACGGGGSLERNDNGGGSTGGGGTSEPTLSVGLSIADQNGQSTNQLTSDTPLVITATVTNSDGAAINDKLVSFSFSQDGLATFNNDTGTALTNADGQATIGLVVGENSGDGLVTATIEDGSDIRTAQIGFRSAGAEQTTVEPAALEFFASSVQLASSGSDQIELVAVVKNDQNILLEGVDVSFSADNDAELQITQGTTAADGTARALISTTTNPRNRTITATVVAGALAETLEIAVVGTEVNLSGATSTTIGADEPAEITIVLTDSDGNGIPNQAISLNAENGNLSNVAPSSGVNGQVTVQYIASTSGEDTITAEALNATGSFTISVQEDEFDFSGVPTEDVPLGESVELSVLWQKEGTPFAGGTVTFTSSRGTIDVMEAVTGADGIASVNISSTNAGIASITAEGVDGDGERVSARTQIEFIATEAATLILDATPDSIGPDGQTSTISAVVRDAEGNLVKGQTVNFSVDDVTGGFVSPNSAITDGSGIASTVYTSNVVSSQDSVVITAQVAEDVAVSDTTTITVGDRAFDITLGTGNSIQSPDESTYLKEFAAFVSDVDGNPVENAVLTASSTPVKFVNGGTYRKGFWTWDPVSEIWFITVTATCANEDINANGRLDAGEDTNGDGQLTPGIVSVATNANDTDNFITDANGQTTIALRYAKQFAPWTDVSLRVSGASSGSEAVESQRFTLTVAADDVNSDDSPPPPNPFGSGDTCTDTL